MPAITPGITPWMRRIMRVAVSVGIYIVMPVRRSIRIGNPNHCALESTATVIDPESTPTKDD